MLRGITPLYILKFLALFLACFLGSEAAILLYVSPAIFPVNAGIALAGTVLGGVALAPAVFLAAFASYMLHGSPLMIGLAIGLANALQAGIGAYILRLLNFDPLMRRMRDIFSIGAVAVLASAIVPSIVMLTYKMYTIQGGRPPSFSWFNYWGGDIWALLIISPFLIRWLAKPFYARTPAQHLEALAALLLLVVCNYIVFWQLVPGVTGIVMIFVLFAPFFWLALRLSPRFVTFGLVLTSAMAYVAVRVVPSTSAVAQPLGERLFQTELFLIFVAAIFFVLESIANERRYAIEALRIQIRQLEDALRRISAEDVAKTEFISVLAHEIRNPLAPIMSGIEILETKQHDGESHRIITMMGDRVNAIRRLLEDLLDVARITQKKLVIQKERVDLKQVVERSLAAIEELSLHKTRRSEITLPADPLYVEGDSVRLEQIFVNVLTNAVKYTDPGSTIQVALTSQGEWATIRVKDNGRGIEAHMLKKIFEPFVQAESARASHMGTGLGIGLALTKRLVEIHDGSIEARSEGLGKGSEFLIRVPLVDGKAEPVTEVPAQKGSRKKPSRVLVVDDNVPAAEAIDRLLKHVGYTAETAFSGSDAIARAKAFRPDVILLDIGLPDMNGYDVARTLRAADIFRGKLIALTGYGQLEDKNRAANAGFDAHLTKPVSIKDVEAAIAS